MESSMSLTHLVLCGLLSIAHIQLSSSKPQFAKGYYKSGDLSGRPFVPPAFYDDSSEYHFRDSIWTPPENKKPATTDNIRKQLKPATSPVTTGPVTDKPTHKPTGKPTGKPHPAAFQDACKTIYCKYGRTCELDKAGKGHCVCAGPDYCLGHSKQVCGSDGVVYPSHCELHRMACVRDTHIAIDHTGAKCATPPPESKKESWKPPVFDVTKEVEKNADEKQKADSRQQLEHDFQKFPDYSDTAAESDYSEPEPHLHGDKSAAGQTDPDPAALGGLTPNPCEELEYNRLKSNLLQYHCARIGEIDCATDPSKKQFVANIMFNYYDKTSDQQLTEAEMSDIEHRNHLDKLSRFCHLTDFLSFSDRNGDGNISLTEFYTAYHISTVRLDEELKVFSSRVTRGNSVELRCDIEGAVEIVWQRNGAPLDKLVSSDIQVFTDGSLYLKNIGLHHIGNYTCQDRYEDSVQQTHILKVQMTPEVKVSPSTQFHTSGGSVKLRCHADGVPEPEIRWEMNEEPLTVTPDNKHYLMLHNKSTLEIKKAMYTKDTGAYKCVASNSAGTSQDIATVFIENSNVPKYSKGGSIQEVFLVFHDHGYSVYEPRRCHLEHQVTPGFSNLRYVPSDTGLPQLCDKDHCSWGSAVNVRDRFIYISQPELHRVVVIEITKRINPVEIIPTDKYPVKLQYVEHLDQVWVLCWNGPDDSGDKTAVVIQRASENSQHHSVHMQPVAGQFDLINDMFLPLNNDLRHEFDFGYVTHLDEQGLYKVNLRTMAVVRHIDLTRYSCLPKSLAFVPMGGQVIVHCMSPLGQTDKSTRLVIDYVTDRVLEHTALGGEPYLSPDARYLVTVETDGNTVSVSKLLDDGSMEHIFDEYTNLHISDVTFFPSSRGHGYDFYASATNRNDVLYIQLDSGKVEMIQGVGPAMDPQEWPWSQHNRVILGGGMFGDFLMTPSKDSVVVIDGERRSVQCQWQDIKHGNVVAWVNPIHL